MIRKFLLHFLFHLYLRTEVTHLKLLIVDATMIL